VGVTLRRALTGANALLVAAFALVFLAAVSELASRFRWRLDLTEGRSATLLPETRAVLDRLADRGVEVDVTAFSAQKRNADAWSKDRMMRDLLRELELASPRVHTKFVDFDADRRTAEDLGVDRYGQVVLAGAGTRVDLTEREMFRSVGKGADRELSFSGEDAFGKGLGRLLDSKVRTIYALRGHGEHEPYDRGLGELRTLSSLAENQGWRVRPLDLLRDAAGEIPTVPDDAAAVIALGPTAPVGSGEEAALRNYLVRGGSIGWWTDGGRPSPAFFDDLGLSVLSGVVYDPAHVYPFEDRPLLSYGRHAITAPVSAEGLATVVAAAAPLAVEPREGVTASVLLTTGGQGWIERGTERPAHFDAGVDGAGPVAVAYALEVRRPNPLGGGRLVVVGDTDVLTDEILGDGPGNASFLVNTLRWLVSAEEKGSVVARPGSVRRIALSPGQITATRAVVLGIVPLLPLIAALGVRAARRAR
jgi:hypothetical protein